MSDIDGMPTAYMPGFDFIRQQNYEGKDEVMGTITLAEYRELLRIAAVQDFVGRGAASRDRVRPLDFDNIGEVE